MNGGGGSSGVIQTELFPSWATELTIDGVTVHPIDKYIELINTEFQAAYVAYTGSTYALQGEGFTWTDDQGVQTVASHTYELDGIKALAARGRNGNAAVVLGETLLRDVIDGLKLNSNTKIDDAYLKKAEVIVTYFEENTLPELAQRMNLSGNFGSRGHHVLMAKAAEEVMAKLADIGMELYFKDYLLEKSLQQDAVSLAPSYGNEQIRNADIQIKAGELQREYEQGRRIDAYNQWKEVKYGPLKKLEIAGNAIRTLIGTSKKEVTPYNRPSDISQIAGLALAGMGIYGMYKDGQEKSEKLAGSSRTPAASRQYLTGLSTLNTSGIP